MGSLGSTRIVGGNTSRYGTAPSGGVGDAYCHALAQTAIGLFKTEVIDRDGPWRGFENAEIATVEWVTWFNRDRLLEPLGDVPPAVFEAQYYRTQDTHKAVVILNETSLLKTLGNSVCLKPCICGASPARGSARQSQGAVPPVASHSFGRHRGHRMSAALRRNR